MTICRYQSRAAGLVCLILLCSASPAAAPVKNKIDPWLLERAADKELIEFIVVIDERADAAQWATIKARDLRLRMAVASLQEMARESQRPLLRLLEKLNVGYRPFWIANAVRVRGSPELMFRLARRTDVLSIDSNPPVPLSRTPVVGPSLAKGIEWNINLVGAPEVWALGIRGEGAVIGGQDTGYQWEHTALMASYRGWNGKSADHDYNWHDAIHESLGGCGADSPAPCDDDDHGTHTMGTMVGDDGGNNQTGMAPGARWIGCRNMDGGVGTPERYMECFQWFLAPTTVGGTAPDPSRAPHVINNSWACPAFEGCTKPNALLQTVENVRSAGIVVVVSAGNGGDACGTVEDPPAIYDASFSVGATDVVDGIAGFSSRGPVTVDGSNRPKPDIVAPGAGVRSSVRDGYAVFSGTSMAGPHVAGLVALLVSADPSLAGDVAGIENIIRSTALPLTAAQTCGGVPGSQVPNNTYGDGRIDALAAVNAARRVVFADGFEEPQAR